LQEAVNRAIEEGRKVKPADVPNANKPKFTFKDCFENSDIDNSDADAGYIVIKMPVEEFEFIRDALKL